MHLPRIFASALSVALPAALLLTVSPASAAEFEGDYVVTGEMEGGRGYKGVARVAKTGDTYTIAWKIGQESHLGTGILSGGQLSTVFVGAGIPGVAVYRRSPDGKVLGVYTQFGGTQTAIETWEPVPAAEGQSSR
ncbi:hypothetical protein [Indioceanicola profundi]|uniref:hypothetical protein n=1 Tax=Indioceanicola profundi TaxID=2220096 RepID=UPI000E6AB745|nr:hypothetical protein [Indioceanicola profundi]